MKESAGPYSVRAVERAVSVLNALADADEPLTLTEIARRVELSIPTVFRLTRTLEDSGLVVPDANSEYLLGHRLIGLYSALLRQLGVPADARSILGRVRDRTGESATMVVRTGDRYIHATLAESHQTLRRVPTVGLPLALHHSPAGLVILAFDSARQIDDYVERASFTPGRPGIPSDGEALRSRLHSIRERGFDEAVEADGTAKVAVPARGMDGSIATGVYVSGPSSRFTESAQAEWLAAAQSAAHDLSVAMGYSG